MQQDAATAEGPDGDGGIKPAQHPLHPIPLSKALYPSGPGSPGVEHGSRPLTPPDSPLARAAAAGMTITSLQDRLDGLAADPASPGAVLGGWLCTHVQPCALCALGHCPRRRTPAAAGKVQHFKWPHCYLVLGVLPCCSGCARARAHDRADILLPRGVTFHETLARASSGYQVQAHNTAAAQVYMLIRGSGLLPGVHHSLTTTYFTRHCSVGPSMPCPVHVPVQARPRCPRRGSC